MVKIENCIEKMSLSEFIEAFTYENKQLLELFLEKEKEFITQNQEETNIVESYLMNISELSLDLNYKINSNDIDYEEDEEQNFLNNVLYLSRILCDFIKINYKVTDSALLQKYDYLFTKTFQKIENIVKVLQEEMNRDCFYLTLNLMCKVSLIEEINVIQNHIKEKNREKSLIF